VDNGRLQNLKKNPHRI